MHPVELFGDGWEMWGCSVEVFTDEPNTAVKVACGR